MNFIQHVMLAREYCEALGKKRGKVIVYFGIAPGPDREAISLFEFDDGRGKVLELPQYSVSAAPRMIGSIFLPNSIDEIISTNSKINRAICRGDTLNGCSRVLKPIGKLRLESDSLSYDRNLVKSALKVGFSQVCFFSDNTVVLAKKQQVVRVSAMDHCPNCGKKIPEGKGFCPECLRAGFVLVCSECKSEVSEEDKHCKKCGHVLS